MLRILVAFQGQGIYKEVILQCFFAENGEKFYVDIEGKSQIEILQHLQKVVGKPR